VSTSASPEAPAEASVRRLLLVRVLPFVVGIIALIYFARQIFSYWPSIIAISFTPAIAVAIGVAAALQAASGLVDAWSWGWLMRSLAVPVQSREAMPIFLVSQFAKYVPGSIGSHVGRLALGKQHGLPAPSVLLSLVIENGFALGAGAVFGGASAVFGIAVTASNVSRMAWTLSLVIVAWLAGAITLRLILAHPPAFVRRLLRLEKPVTLKTSFVAGYFLLHVTSYAAIGAALVIVVFGYAGSTGPEVWRVALAGTAGWFAGYILPGAPAGLGVREATLTALLTPLCGPTVAVSSALLWRSSALLADGALFLIGLATKPRPVADIR
jgi:uncharacterized membrane protein YbhN (UPF0104 family)